MENNGYFKPESINLDGFSVVERQAFTRGVIVGPKMTLWKDSLAFSADCVKMLNRCDCVQMLVNKETRMIAIRAVPSSAPNSIQWINQKGTGKKKDCIKFCSEMFLFMGWDENFKYRADGRMVLADNTPMLLFSLSDAVKLPKDPAVYRKKPIETAN